MKTESIIFRINSTISDTDIPNYEWGGYEQARIIKKALENSGYVADIGLSKEFGIDSSIQYISFSKK